MTKSRNILLTLLGVLLGILFFGSIDLIFGAEVHSDLTLYTTSTDQDVTIAWDDTNPTLADYFDFYMWNYGEEQRYLIGRTQALQVTVRLPKTGLYIFYCRACDKPESDSTRECSIYANSNLVDEQTGVPYGKIADPNNPGQFIQGKWMIYGHVAAPTGGGVD